MSIKTKDLITPVLQHQLTSLGHNLKLARKKRKWSVEKVRADIKCAKGTLEDAEKGKPTVNIGVYLLLIDLYGFKLDLAALTHPSEDCIGQSLSGRSTPHNRVSPADF